MKNLSAQFLEPFNDDDPIDRLADKYRKQFLGVMLRALKKGGNDEFLAAMCGSFVGVAEGAISHGVKPEDLAKALHDIVDFAVAQATRGEIVSPEFLTRYGAGGNA